MPTVANLRDERTQAMSRSTRLLWLVVRAYQVLFAWRTPRCRYWPSCSAYTLEALQQHGFWHGGKLALQRIARCHPWGGAGVDPVPLNLAVASVKAAPRSAENKAGCTVDDGLRCRCDSAR